MNHLLHFIFKKLVSRVDYKVWNRTIKSVKPETNNDYNKTKKRLNITA